MIHISPPPLSSQSMADLLCTIVLLCRGKDNFKRDFWAYMCIKPSMVQAFQEAQNTGSFMLGDYGSIIEAGPGTTPPDDVKKRMERDFGVKHNYEEQLLKAMEDLKKQNT